MWWRSNKTHCPVWLVKLLNTNFVVLSQACCKSSRVADFVVVYHFQDRLSDVRGRVDKTRQVLEGEIHRRQQMRKDLETIRMWVVKIEVLINSKLSKHEEMDEKEIKVCSVKGSQSATIFVVCLDARVELLKLLWRMSKRRNCLKLLKVMKHTFKNTAYIKAIRFHFTMHFENGADWPGFNK